MSFAHCMQWSLGSDLGSGQVVCNEARGASEAAGGWNGKGGRGQKSCRTLCPLREAQGGQRLLLSTLHQEEYEFMSPSSVAIAELVALFLDGLKERSVFAMALQDRKATGAQPGGSRVW